MNTDYEFLGKSTPSNGGKDENKVSRGALVQALEMSIFSLDLSYFKLYRPTRMDTVKLPASTADLIRH